ncbi:MAG: acetyl-CoA hydrolase/transferase family protein [Deltaproteobacteria bacterium]|nr:acetyl-CoA hydrolase/transferase family protein [Deltaproteobacteria bacterium]
MDRKKRILNLENWPEQYRQKLLSLEQAAGLIKSGDKIFIPNGYVGELPYAIVARRDELRQVQVEVTAPAFDPGWLLPGMEESFEIQVRTYLHLARPGHDEGRIQFLPYTNWTWFKPYRDRRRVARDIDVLLLEVSPPDENGFCTLGAVAWEKNKYIREAKIVIAEIDDYQIRSRGDTAIHISEIDYLVNISAPPVTEEEALRVAARFPAEKQERARDAALLAHPRLFRRVLPFLDLVELSMIEFQLNMDEPDDTAKAIARNLKDILNDHDTIQIGVGKPSKYMIELGVFDQLNDLSIFSEMACPGMGFLIKRGIATGKFATLHPGKAVFTGLIGFRPEEIRWADDNPLIELHGADYVLNIGNISRNENMVAINNITQVDLLGQITCETQFGPRLINGPGGQIEFHLGAFFSPGGKAVSLLPSTWGGGGISTIVPQLDEGSVVSIPRVYADYVVTEWGVAQLTGRTNRERAQALIQIAHPDFRDELREAAKKIS